MRRPPDGAARVDVVERAGKVTSDPDRRSRDVTLEVLDHRVGQQPLHDLVQLREPVLGELALDLELEPLALADVADTMEAEPGSAPCTALPCGSRISGLSMTSTTTRATGEPLLPCSAAVLPAVGRGQSRGAPGEPLVPSR